MIISAYLREDHRECDNAFAKAEEAAGRGDWEATRVNFELFATQTLTHFKKEEEELFVAFEGQTGNSQGPTMVMRYEHTQVRGLIERMDGAIVAKNQETFLSLCESLMILLQQHNMKEEQMLYAMCDRLLAATLKEELIGKMKKVEL